MVKSVPLDAQPQNEILRSWGLGGCPQQAAPEAEWLSTGIACYFLADTKTASEETTNFTRWPILFQVSWKFPLVPPQIHEYGSIRFPASLADSLDIVASSHFAQLHLVSAPA